jgi:PPOX class probable F420-dependent enzyme
MTRTGGLQIEPGISEYLRNHRLGVLATVNKNGSPQQVLIAYRFDGEEIAISTPGDSLKITNTRRRPQISLAITDGPAQLIASGTVELISDPAEVLRQHLERPLLATYQSRLMNDDAAVTRLRLERERAALRRPPLSEEEFAEMVRTQRRVVMILRPRRFYPASLST